MTTQGIIYIAAGQRYIDEAVQSATSVKRHSPQLAITLFCDQAVSAECFDDVVQLQSSGNALQDKIQVMQDSPYEYTLYLDTDTYICADIAELFNLLEHFDIAAAHAPNRHAYPLDDVPISFPELNTGVVLFRQSEKMTAFLNKWLARYNSETWTVKNRHLNQPSFRHTLYFSDLRLATLTPEYNCRFYDSGYLQGTVKILHGHAELRRFQQVEAVLANREGQRVYVAGELHTQRKRPPLLGGLARHRIGRFLDTPLERGLRKLRQDGLGKTLNHLLKRLRG